MKKSVSFQSVEVSVFRPTLGDNPSVKSGVPVAMGNDCVFKYSASIDEYEKVNLPVRLSCSEYNRQGKLSSAQRLKLAAQSGCSYDDLKSSLRGVRQAKPKSFWNMFHVPKNLSHKKTKKEFLEKTKTALDSSCDSDTSTASDSSCGSCSFTSHYQSMDAVDRFFLEQEQREPSPLSHTHHFPSADDLQFAMEF